MKRILSYLGGGLLAAAVGVAIGLALHHSYIEPGGIRFKPRVSRGTSGTQVPVYSLQPVGGPGEPIEKLVAVQVQINGRSGLFLVDTGANTVTVSERFARAIPVESTQPIPVETHFGVSVMQVFQAESLRIGEVVYRDFFVPIMKLQHIQNWTHTDLDGILGGNVLNALPYELDFAARQLTIGRDVVVPKEQAVRISVKDDLLIAEAKVNGRPNRFILDTGATSSLIRREDVDRLFAPEEPTLSPTSVRVVDIKQDRAIERKEVVLPEVRLGPAIVREIKAGLFEENLLGQDFLNGFTLTVDARRRRLALTPSGQN